MKPKSDTELKGDFLFIMSKLLDHNQWRKITILGTL